MNIQIRTIDESEMAAFYTAINLGMGGDPPDDESALDHFRAIMPVEGTLAAFDGDRIVGTFGTFFFDLTVPGSVVSMAGTTVVSVLPTHRRQGILTRMMQKHLADMKDRGQVVAGLWASEYGIYRRFGYGSATDRAHLKMDRRLVSFPDGPEDVTVRLVDSDEAARTFPSLYDTVRRGVPGMFSRSHEWWEHRVLHDANYRRSGGSALRHVLAERDGSPVGYASYRQKSNWEGWRPESEVVVTDHGAIDPGGRRAIWSFLSRIDLHPHLTVASTPIDHPLLWEVAQPRYMDRSISDALWVRILDLKRALEARTYAGSGSVVFEVEDPVLDDVGGRYLLEVESGKASVTPTDRDPDVALGIAELGALYLGGRSLRVQVETGRASGDEDAIDLVDQLFSTAVAPYCHEVF